MNSKPEVKRSPLSRRTLFKTLGLACLACSPMFQACNLLSSENHSPEKKLETKKAMDYSGLPPAAPRPPIDLAAPVRTETATFALG